MTSRSASVRVLFLCLALAAALSPWAARAEAPKHQRDFFCDYSGQVPPLEAEEIDRSLEKSSKESGIHCMLVVVQRMSDHHGMPTNARDFAYELAKQWKVGNARNGKGILILFSLGDKKFHAVKSKNLPVSLTDQIAQSMKGGVTLALGEGQVTDAMKRAAQNISDNLPRESPSAAAPSSAATPSKNEFTPIRHTSSGPGQTRQQVEYDKQTRSSGNWGWVILIVGGIILAIIIIAVTGAFGAARRYGTGYGGYGPAYGGYGYGGYGGGGDMLTGMMLGGMMGNMFGGGGRTEHHYHGSAPASGGYDLGSSGSGFGSWGGGDASGGSWGGSSFTGSDGGGFSSFGGGDFGGGSSGGEW